MRVLDKADFGQLLNASWTQACHIIYTNVQWPMRDTPCNSL